MSPSPEIMGFLCDLCATLSMEGLTLSKCVRLTVRDEGLRGSGLRDVVE